MLLLASIATAEPLLGTFDRLAPAERIVEPGVEVFPVNGYGGSVTPELYAGVGLGGGFDVRAGLGVDVPVYHRDDGGLFWGYAPPSLGFVDAAVRWSEPDPGGSAFSAALRVATGSVTPTHLLSVGPELGWAWSRWRLRTSFLTQPEYVPDAFGVLTVTLAYSRDVGRAVAFGEGEPSFWAGMGSRGNSGPIFMVQPGLVARGGVWLNPSSRHAVALAAVYRFDYGFEAEDLSLLVRWRIGSVAG